MSGRTILLNITSDSVCPWCFIGKRRLEQAIDTFKTQHPGTEFQVDWFPYQLEPNMGKEPIPKKEFFPRKFGAGRYQQMMTSMKLVGQSVGINFSYDGVISSSLDSHRLVHWSKQFNKQNQVVEEVFKLYFEQDQNLSDVKALSAAAAKAGLDPSAAEAFLNSGEGTEAVKQLVHDNQRRGINGVPHIVIDNKYTLSGAQEPETFIKIFEQVLKSSN